MRTGPKLATIGELTLDDVVVEDEDADWKQAGGGGLYSAVGAMVWSQDVALSSAIGGDYPSELLKQVAACGLDTRAVTRFEEMASVGLWLLYEREGTRRQLEKRRGSTFAAIDAMRDSPFERGLAPLGVHIAPQSSQGQRRARTHLEGRDVIRTMDVLIEPGIDQSPYLSGELFRGLDAFLPSEQEVVDLWGHTDIRRLSAWMVDRGCRQTLVIKRGPLGADVLTDGKVVRVPSVVETLVDPTGAGDAFCGGFLAGLVATGDPVEAAVHGVVSASFTCEARGALAAVPLADPETARRRAGQARKALKEVS